MRITDPSETAIVNKFQVTKAPMPLVLVLAPNGAVTSSFPGNFTKEQLLGALGTPSSEKLLGSLQQGKLVLVCLQNGKTRWNAEAMSGVRAFKADQRYAAAIEVLVLDPHAAVERPLLAKLGINAPARRRHDASYGAARDDCRKFQRGNEQGSDYHDLNECYFQLCWWLSAGAMLPARKVGESSCETYKTGLERAF